MMSVIPRTISFVFLGLVFASATARSAPASLEGSIMDRNGKTLPGADVRIETSGGSKWNKVVRADAKGHYACSGLLVGSNYRVTVLVSGAVKASMNVKMTSGTT